MLDVGVDELEGGNSLKFVTGRLGEFDFNVIKFVGNVLRGNVLGWAELMGRLLGGLIAGWNNDDGA